MGIFKGVLRDLGNRLLMRKFGIKCAQKTLRLMRQGGDSLFLNENQTTVIHNFSQILQKNNKILKSLKQLIIFRVALPFRTLIQVHRKEYYFIIYNTKSNKMQYFEQLRLLFIIFMAYLSYRKLNSTYENPIDDFAIYPEQEDDDIIQEEIKRVHMAEEEPINQENDVNNVEDKAQTKDYQSNQCSDNEIMIASFERKSTQETAQINEDSQDSQEQSDQNQSASLKSTKTKLIRKQPRRTKKKASLQTIITSENQQFIGLEETPSFQKEKVFF